MEREEMKRIQKEMEKRLGDDWDIQPVTVNKVGGQREGLSCRYQEEKRPAQRRLGNTLRASWRRTTGLP